MKISVIGDIINDSLNEKELEIMRHFSRTELKAAINMLKEFTAKGNFAVLMYMGDTDKLEVSQTLNSDMSCFLLYGSIQPLAFFFAENIPMTAGELEEIINKQSAVYEEEMDNYRNALKESGADNAHQPDLILQMFDNHIPICLFFTDCFCSAIVGIPHAASA